MAAAAREVAAKSKELKAAEEQQRRLELGALDEDMEATRRDLRRLHRRESSKHIDKIQALERELSTLYTVDTEEYEALQALVTELEESASSTSTDGCLSMLKAGSGAR